MKKVNMKFVIYEFQVEEIFISRVFFLLENNCSTFCMRIKSKGEIILYLELIKRD